MAYLIIVFALSVLGGFIASYLGHKVHDLFPEYDMLYVAAWFVIWLTSIIAAVVYLHKGG